MNNRKSLVLFVVIILIIIGLFIANKVQDNKFEQTVSESVQKQYEEPLIIPMPEPLLDKIEDEKSLSNKGLRSDENEVSLAQVEKVNEDLVPNIPLDIDVHRYIKKRSEEEDISYTLMLAIAKHESWNFDDKWVYEVPNSGGDYGLFQINAMNFEDTEYEEEDWLEDLAGMEEEVDPFNPYENTELAIAYVKYLIDYWNQQNVSEEQKYDLVVMSYNMGISRATKHVKKYGYNSDYLDTITSLKEELERSMEVYE